MGELGPDFVNQELLIKVSILGFASVLFIVAMIVLGINIALWIKGKEIKIVNRFMKQERSNGQHKKEEHGANKR